MSDVLFCKSCGGHVPESDLEQGRGIREGNGAVCGDCIAEQSTPKKKRADPTPRIPSPPVPDREPQLFSRPEANSEMMQDRENSNNQTEDQLSAQQEQELIEEMGLMENGGYPDYLENMEEEPTEIDKASSGRPSPAGARKGRSARSRRSASQRSSPKDRKASGNDRRSKRQAGASRRTSASPAAKGASRRMAKEPAPRGNSRRASTKGARQSTRGEREPMGSDRNSRRGSRAEPGTQDNNQMIIIGSVVGVLVIVGMFFMFSGNTNKGKRKRSGGTSASALVERARAKESSGDKLGAADLYGRAADAYSKAGDEGTATRYSMKAYGLRKHSTLNLQR